MKSSITQCSNGKSLFIHIQYRSKFWMSCGEFKFNCHFMSIKIGMFFRPTDENEEIPKLHFQCNRPTRLFHQRRLQQFVQRFSTRLDANVWSSE
ncbi:unnamed protein product [Larinioides sclopetarius]|uniref:Uncharacterized protein n=1 Tax=Larinioides sclopetarius TaxID=280406 RepID=A0AAV2A857_9ARAC